MNELRAENERKIYEISNQNLRNTESQMQKADSSRKLILQKSKDEIAVKNEKIRTLEKNEKKSRQDQDKMESMKREMQILQENYKNL